MFRRLTIQRKLVLILWGAALVAFVLAGTALVLYQNFTLERRARQIMEPYVQFVAAATETAVAFEDSVRAEEMLSPLRANPEIREAAIILESGKVLASYGGVPTGELDIKLRPSEDPYVDSDKAELVRALNYGARLHLVMSRAGLDEQTYQLLWVFGGALLVFLVITFAQTLVLQRAIIRPVAALSEAAEFIRHRADYSHRVPAEGGDELAKLGQSFNAMMQAIRERDDALQQKTEELDGYFTNALDLLCITDENGRFRRLNPEWVSTLGYSLNELTGQSFLNLVHPDDREETERIARLSSREEILNFINRYRCKDGTYRWIEWRSYPAGKVVYATARDITLRREAEETVRQKTEELDRYFTSALDLLCIADTDGYFRRLNPQWETALGYKVTELAGRRFLDLVHPDDLEPTLQNVSRLTGQDEVLDFTNRYRARNGEYRWIEWRAFASGKLIYAVARDISERKRAEQALQKFQYSIDRATDAIYWISRDAHFTYVNDQACRSLGYTREELMRLTLWEIDPLFPREIWEENWRQFQAQKIGGGEQVESVHRRKDGSTFPIEVVSNHIWFGEEELHVAVVRDITERKAAAEQLRRMASEQRTILHTTSLGITFVKNRRLQWGNPVFGRMFGYGADELSGLDTRCLYSRDEDYELVGRAAYTRFAKGERFQMDLQAQRKDGSVFWCELIGQAVDPQDMSEGTIWVLQDISERKQAEAALRENEERLRLALSATNQGMYDLNLQTGHAIVNPEYARMIGYEPGEVEFTVRWWREHLHPDDLAATTKIIEECINGTCSEYRTEYRLRTKGGDWRWILSLGKVVEHDPDGRSLRMLGTHTDITERHRAEQALKESESLLRRSQSVARLGSYSFKAKTGTWIASPGLDELFGIDAHFPRSVESWLTLVHPEDRAEMQHYFQNHVLAQHNRFEKAYRIVRQDNGEERWVFGLGELEFDADGNPLRMIGTIQDITERKDAELALERSLSLLVATLESTADGILVEDGSGQIAEYNQRFAELWRFPVEALESKDEEAAMTHVLNQLKDPAAFTAKADELYLRPESDSFDVLEFKDGRVIERYSRPQLVDGRPVGRVWSFRDVTDRIRAEAALRESEQKFRLLFEHMAEGVALHELISTAKGDPLDYRIIDVNTAYGRHTGLDPDKVRGRLASVVYGGGAPPYLKEWAEVARTGRHYVFEDYFAPMGKHFHISVVSPRPGFFATVFEDITERKHTEEELRRKNEELERFTYTVSHDLKSPLITIKGFTGALQQDIAAGRLQRLEGDLRRIADATDKMADLLNDLLELSRVGRIMNPPAQLSLGELVQEVLELLAGPIKERQVKVEVQPDLPSVFGDRRRLLEVYQNLIENAVRYLGDQRRPRLEIGMRDDKGAQVFFIRDNGLGIEPRYHETVFGLFNKLDAKTPGTGIGLALVRRIIEVHSGKIWVESEGLGRGSTFCFTLAPAPNPRKE